MDRQHPLVLGVEGDLEDLVVLRPPLRRPDRADASVHLRARVQDGNLCGRSAEDLLALLHLHIGTVVQQTAQSNVGEGFPVLRREGLRAGLAVEHLQALAGSSGHRHNQVLHRHLALGERAGLVRAEHGHATQGLDGVDLADQDELLRHLLRSDHERNRDCGQQALGHLGKECGGAVLQDVSGGALHRGHQVGDQAQCADKHRHDGDDVDEVLDLDLQGGLCSGAFDALGDLSQEGAVARGVDEAAGVALEHRRPEEGEVPRFCWGARDGLRLRVPGLGHGLAGERGVVHLHAVGAAEDPHVCGHSVAGLEEDDVPGHQVDGVQLDVHSLAALVDPHGRDLLHRLHLLQRRHLIFRLLFGVPLQHRCHHDHSRQNDRRHIVGLLGVLRILLGGVQRPGRGDLQRDLGGLPRGRAARGEGDEGDLGRDATPKEDVEDAEEGLLKKLEPLVLLLRRRDLVPSIDLEVAPRLLLLEAGWPVSAPAVGRDLGLEDR
mmetsp:Transcript_85636/g.239788  ORF Transcript_85636/g.239788 Transcript_85636/m.239788 type:complete len:492 (+) Transcript_85636:160-1635(+)